MKFKPHSVLQGMAGAVVSLAFVAGAQTPAAPAPASTTAPDTTAAATPAATPAAPVWSVGGFDVSGYVDGYFSYNYNRPGPHSDSGGVNQLYNFDDKQNFSLEAAKLTINHDPGPIGAHVDLLFGRTNAFLHSTDSETANYIEQAYVSVKPTKGAHAVELDAGQFVTSAGQEVIETMNNWSYSHGILFGYAIPYYHFGLRTTMPVTKTWTVGAQLVNGWNNDVDNNGGVTIGVTSSLVEPKFTWNANYYTGPENDGTQKGYRNLFDTTLLLTPTPKFSAYVNYDYGENNTPAFTVTSEEGETIAKFTETFKKDDPHWQGVAVSARGQITGNSALVGRYEYFSDNQGFATTGMEFRQNLNEFTGTYEYKCPAGLLFRAEYRRDWSDHKYFSKGDNGNLVTAQSTATVGLIAFFGPK